MMNRRNFLKRCSILPFVGSLAVVAKAEDSVPKLTEDMIVKTANDMPEFRSPLSLMYEKMGLSTNDICNEGLSKLTAIDRLGIAMDDAKLRGYKVKEVNCTRRFKEQLEDEFREWCPWDIIDPALMNYDGCPVYACYFGLGEFQLWCEGNIMLFKNIKGEWCEDIFDGPLPHVPSAPDKDYIKGIMEEFNMI